MSALKDQILARKNAKKPKAVEVGGQSLFVKMLKAVDVRDLLAWQNQDRIGIHPQVWWVIAGICNEDGSKVFDWGDAEQLNQLDFVDINAMHEAVVAHNDAARTPDEIAKNS